MNINPALPLTDGGLSWPTDDHRDRALMARIRSGDMEAFETLYAAFYQRLVRFIFRTTQRVDLVEDLINDTMLVVWEKPGGFDSSCKVSTWIFGIAYRKALKACAKLARSARDVPIHEIEEKLVDGRASPAWQAELEDILAVALTLLTPEQRAVIELSYSHGLRYQEIATILDCPTNTVKTRMFQARKKLHTLFDGLTPERTDLDGENLT